MSQIRQCAVDTIHAEADAVRRLATLLTDDFEGAVRAILACTGKVVVTGMGKSGLIGKKIAATLASTERLPFSCIRARPITAIWV